MFQFRLLVVLLLLRGTITIHSNDEAVDSDPTTKTGIYDEEELNEGHSVIRQGQSQVPTYSGFAMNATGSRTREILDFRTTFKVGTSCADIQKTQGASKSGIYLIQPPNLLQGPWKVFCDLETDGGLWTVFQVRDDVEPHENFMRNWEDYKVGFGDFDREFWLGNILLWALTNVDNTTEYEMAVDLEDWSGNKRFAKYLSFRVGSEADKYRISYANLYFGNAGDSLYSHNGLPFSTFDVDNDNRDGDFAERSCARLYKGGWWYGNCHDSNLNGWYLGGPHRSFADGINWYTWTGYNYSLRKTRMRFRPLQGNAYQVAADTYLSAHRKYANKIKAGRGEPMHQYDAAVLASDINRLTKP